jgi:hypothetical protein
MTQVIHIPDWQPTPFERPQPQPRAPLPPFPAGSYDRVLPFTPPSRDVLFYRGNFCGVRVPGVPSLPESAGYTLPGGDKTLIMSLEIFRHTPEWQDEILRQHAIRGYTHFQFSIGHAIEQGWPIDQYVTLAKRAQDRFGLFADHWFLGGGPWGWWRGRTDQNRDRDAAYWAPIVDPWIDALLANQAIDCACVGWQLDAQNKESDTRTGNGPLQSIIDHFADKLAPLNIPIGTHWINEAGAWNTPMDRFAWWKRQRNKLTWFHHQGDVNLDVPTYQAKLCDTLNPFGDGRMGRSGLFGDRPFGLVVFEDSAQAQFDDPTRNTEDMGDQRGLLLCCTKAAASVSGFGNGARMSDGSPL